MDNSIEKQIIAARYIREKKLKEWYQKTKKHIPIYLVDYLFYKNGLVDKMLAFDEEKGFAFDPKTLEEGIENTLAVLEFAKQEKQERARIVYKKFADAQTRISYLGSIIDQLDIYHVIGQEVIADLEECAKKWTDAEFLEFVECKKRNINARSETEKKMLAEKNNRQPQ